ncbi:MAG: hypothetical protein BZ138_05510 [Methanosphaera sp. rholeuAM270]|nr:MAG: hypothetical protein BZ138_05510 [Methanosphaera sp. rholeuAM270]
MITKVIFFIGLLMLALVSTTVIYAETVNVGNSSFSLPEGFAVYSTKGDQVALLNGNTTAIRVYNNESHYDVEVLKEYRLKLGYTLTGEDDYDFEGIKINQQNYTKDNTTTALYTFTKHDKFYMIAVSVLNGYSVLNDYDNAVNEIIQSLK